MKFSLILLILMLHFLTSTLFGQIRNDIIVLGSHGGVNINKINISKINGEQVKLFSSGEQLDYKGITSGDYDGDGISEVAVFSIRSNGRIIDRVIVFDHDGSVFADFNAGNRISKLAAINNITSADLNGDGIEEIIVSCSEVSDSAGKFNNLVAFSGSGDLLFSNFEYPGGYNFSGIAGGNFIAKTKGDEIIVYEPYRNDYDRIAIYQQNLSKARLYSYSRQNESINFKLSHITAGDIDGDGLDELVATSKNKIVIFKDKTYLKDFSYGEYNLLGVTCKDFNNDGFENIAIYRSQGDSNPQLLDQFILFKSNPEEGILSKYNYSDFGNTLTSIISISSGCFEANYPLLFLDDSKIQKLDRSHPYFRGKLTNAMKYKFTDIVNKIRPWYTNASADQNLHLYFARHLKYIGTLYQMGETDPVIAEGVRAFTQYALKYEQAFNEVNGNYRRQLGVFIKDLLHESFWLEEICWAYDLLHDKMSRSERIIIRTKLLRLAAKRQIGYFHTRNNHVDGHNLAIAGIGFLLDDRRLLGLAYNGTDISEDAHKKGAWRGIIEQLQAADHNDPVIFDYDKKVDGKSSYSNIGIYLPDYAHYEGTIDYAYHVLGLLIRTAAMAENNNYQNIEELFPKIDKMATTLFSTVYPFRPDKPKSNLSFPALNDGRLQGLTTISYLEILNSKFYKSVPSPYGTILSKDINNFDNFIFSNNSYNNNNDAYINSSQNMQHVGWGILRSSHDIGDPNKLMLLMDYGPYGGNNHGHADRFNIVLFSNYDGEYKELCGDIGILRKAKKGKISYSTPLHNRYVRSTLSHNTILINNNRQADPNRELTGKCQVDLPLYGGNEEVGYEIPFANKKCSTILFESDNSDSLQYISATSGFDACYGPDYSVKRTLAMIADKYIVDIVDIEKKSGAEIKFIDWVIHGPNTNILTNQTMVKATGWDWERSKFAIPYPNESYNYLYNINTTENNLTENWQSYWTNSSAGSDTLLQIFGINTGNQRLITAFSPDSSAKYNTRPEEIKASIIARKYSISDDWSPEFLSVIRPAGAPSIQSVEIEDSFIVIKNKEEKIYTFDIKNLILR